MGYPLFAGARRFFFGGGGKIAPGKRLISPNEPPRGGIYPECLRRNVNEFELATFCEFPRIGINHFDPSPHFPILSSARQVAHVYPRASPSPAALVGCRNCYSPFPPFPPFWDPNVWAGLCPEEELLVQQSTSSIPYSTVKEDGSLRRCSCSILSPTNGSGSL